MAKKAPKTAKTKRSPKKPAPASEGDPKPENTVHELEIALLAIKPRIWRRFTLRSSVTLAKLHEIVQVVMGWTDSHLHQFVAADDTRYAEPSPFGDPDWDDHITDTRQARIADILPAKGDQALYMYDFGDGWEHLIEVVAVRPLEPGEKTPRCLAGKRSCPPEDCGGPYGYPGLLATLADPSDPDHADMLEWLGGPFDPEAFELDEINAALKRLR